MVLAVVSAICCADLGEISSEEDDEDEDDGRNAMALAEGGPDDSQQAAEAMVQLGNFGYFAQPAQGKNSLWKYSKLSI